MVDSATFLILTGALEVRYRELRQEGVGTVVKHAAVVTSDEEDMLWQSKVIGKHLPGSLQRAVFSMWAKRSACEAVRSSVL